MFIIVFKWRICRQNIVICSFVYISDHMCRPSKGLRSHVHFLFVLYNITTTWTCFVADFGNYDTNLIHVLSTRPIYLNIVGAIFCTLMVKCLVWEWSSNATHKHASFTFILHVLYMITIVMHYQIVLIHSSFMFKMLMKYSHRIEIICNIAYELQCTTCCANYRLKFICKKLQIILNLCESIINIPIQILVKYLHFIIQHWTIRSVRSKVHMNVVVIQGHIQQFYKSLNWDSI